MRLEKAKDWIQNEVKESVKSIEQLPGSTSSLVYEVKTTKQSLVLRQFNNEDWLLEEPDLIQHEVAGLQKARQVEVQTPDILAFEETGARAGMPSVLMTKVAGKVELMPTDFKKWTDGLAKALAAIHQLEADRFPWKHAPYVDVKNVVFPEWTLLPDVWKKAIEVVQQPRAAFFECFIHRDYHPANVLWANGEVTGIVDWGGACRGPAGIDVGHCRVNLALLHGVDIADLFLTSYIQQHPAFDYDPYFDLASAVDFLEGPPTVYKGWLDFGMQGLTDQLMEERMDAFIKSVVERSS